MRRVDSRVAHLVDVAHHGPIVVVGLVRDGLAWLADSASLIPLIEFQLPLN